MASWYVHLGVGEHLRGGLEGLGMLMTVDILSLLCDQGCFGRDLYLNYCKIFNKLRLVRAKIAISGLAPRGPCE